MIPTMYHASHLMKYKGSTTKLLLENAKGEPSDMGFMYIIRFISIKVSQKTKWFTKIRLDILYYSGCFDQKLLFSTGMLAKLSL